MFFFVFSKLHHEKKNAPARMSRWKLGSMVRISGLFHPSIFRLEVGEITHLLTIDPNFLGHPSKAFLRGELTTINPWIFELRP